MLYEANSKQNHEHLIYTVSDPEDMFVKRYLIITLSSVNIAGLYDVEDAAALLSIARQERRRDRQRDREMTERELTQYNKVVIWPCDLCISGLGCV